MLIFNYMNQDDIHNLLLITNAIVSAIGKALASIGLASSLYHASQTTFGRQYDQKLIDLILWIIYREALQNLNLTDSDKTIILDLSDTPDLVLSSNDK